MRLLAVPLLFVVVLFLGCSEKEYPPIDAAAAKEVKSGTAIAEIDQQFGPHHPPTSVQRDALAGLLSKMPEKTKANAEADESVAWGNNSKFLVGKVNSDGVVWAVAWRGR